MSRKSGHRFSEKDMRKCKNLPDDLLHRIFQSIGALMFALLVAASRAVLFCSRRHCGLFVRVNTSRGNPVSHSISVSTRLDYLAFVVRPRARLTEEA